MRIFATIVVVIILLLAGALWLNRPVTIRYAGSVPDEFPGDSFSHRYLESLLQTFVAADGSVDYAAWQSDEGAVARLDDYLVAVATFSPESHPERFETRDTRLAYWMYAYNAYVIRAVLENWPIESVTDLKAPIEAVKGLGFFYRNRYLFGGKAYSLLAIENDKIRDTFRDPRIHFVLNCASESCPVLRPDLPVGTELEALLAEAEREFILDPANVSVDHDAQVIRLSPIFKMYRKDFMQALRATGQSGDASVVGYLLAVAPDALRDELISARDYEVKFEEFAWQLNAAQESAR